MISNYITISLTCHTSKILPKIIQKHIKPYMKKELATEQAGFSRNRGIRDHIANIGGLWKEHKNSYKTFISP